MKTILKEEIFKNENFQPEKDVNSNFLTYEFFKGGEEFICSDLKPDFIIKKIPKENFLKIIDERKIMFNHDPIYNSLKNIEYNSLFNTFFF